MLHSDRDIRAQLDSGRVVLQPDDPQMLQPSSVDVRMDRFFRLFDNHKYPVIDPAQEQPDLTRLGLLTHSTAGLIDPGVSGHVTLELSNVARCRSCCGPG